MSGRSGRQRNLAKWLNGWVVGTVRTDRIVPISLKLIHTKLSKLIPECENMNADVILSLVREKISKEERGVGEAATKIGVTRQSLERHLAGEYVRSDSLAKYRMWLAGNTAGSVQPITLEEDSFPSADDHTPQPKDLCPPSLPDRPHYVVDLFCGAGGMSLGFDRLADGKAFKTVLAVDIEEPMVRVFNQNHPNLNGKLMAGRQIDMTDFLCESEVLAFYLDHLAYSGLHSELEAALISPEEIGLEDLKLSIREVDNTFLRKLKDLRAQESFIEAYKTLAKSAVGQTSVVGFHRALKLPQTGLTSPRLEQMLWLDDGKGVKPECQKPLRPSKQLLSVKEHEAIERWDYETARLFNRAEGSGSGQLSSSAKRISRFCEFLQTDDGEKLRLLWTQWRGQRDAIRSLFFEILDVHSKLKRIYEKYRVSVLLGGPPCQGFSRIGRGKIRSLREQSVHVHENDESVDQRNELLHQYILFLSALQPEVFLFENVRHFQTVVKSGEHSFNASEILAEAIEQVSQDGLSYSVQSNIIKAAHHLVPQKRERYFMSGVRNDINTEIMDRDALAAWCLELNKKAPVPLEIALEGLPEPHGPKADSSKATHHGIVQVATVRAESGDISAEAQYRNWIAAQSGGGITDGHIARIPRPDDRSFFRLLGPGTRWMDYRCDKSPTLESIKSVFEKLISSLDEEGLGAKLGIDSEELVALNKKLDGSLSIRLLLESLPLMQGEVEHHLLAPNYLKKRDGSHGDWLSRMDASKPSKTMVSHMSKDTYAYVHPLKPRTISVREAARIQSFPDDYKLSCLGLVDGFKVIGNAVPPLISHQLASKVIQLLSLRIESSSQSAPEKVKVSIHQKIENI